MLREFDAAVGTSTRPALITHLTGSSSVGGSPLGFGMGTIAAAGARVVGNMMFDPQRMCWVSTLRPEEDEPDVFADLADDEDEQQFQQQQKEEEEDEERKGGTVTLRPIHTNTGTGPRISDVSAVSSMDGYSRDGSTSPAPSFDSHSRTISESGSERGSRASMVVCDVDDMFLDRCRRAEERHRSEMRGWKTAMPGKREGVDRSWLYDIRALATRKY